MGGVDSGEVGHDIHVAHKIFGSLVTANMPRVKCGCGARSSCWL